MPRKTTRNNGAAENGTRTSRPRSRKKAAPAVALSEPTSGITEAAGGTGAGNGSTASEPWLDRAEVERLAYFYWLERGGQGGSPEEDWFRAEAELRRRYGLSQKDS